MVLLFVNDNPKGWSICGLSVQYLFFLWWFFILVHYFFVCLGIFDCVLLILKYFLFLFIYLCVCGTWIPGMKKPFSKEVLLLLLLGTKEPTILALFETKLSVTFFWTTQLMWIWVADLWKAWFVVKIS